MARKAYLTWGADGIPVSADEFLRMMFGKLPETAISTSHITALVDALAFASLIIKEKEKALAEQVLEISALENHNRHGRRRMDHKVSQEPFFIPSVSGISCCAKPI